MPVTRGGGMLGTARAEMVGKFWNILCCSNWAFSKVSSSNLYSYNEYSAYWRISGGLELSWNGKIMAFNEGPQGPEIYWNIFSQSCVSFNIFWLTQFQIFKSKLSSSGNQGLYTTTVWRQASICWREAKSPWNLNKWWSKVEKWWGFPAICPITPQLPTSVGPNSHSVHLPRAFTRSLFRCQFSRSLWTGTWGLESISGFFHSALYF